MILRSAARHPAGCTLRRRDLTSRLTTAEHPYSSLGDGVRLRLGAVQRQVKLPLGDAMLDSADTLHAADPRTVASAGRAQVDQAGVYLTNEVFLYRVVDRIITAAGEMVDVEDCYWLDVVRIPASDLAAGHLRIVTPS